MVYGALDLINNYEKKDPFCLFLPLSYPHPPYCVEEPWYSLIDRNKIPGRYEYTNGKINRVCLKEFLMDKKCKTGLKNSGEN